MKAVILAAGYGTRLQRDVSADRSGRFAHLVGVPKPLLPVGRFPLITHWVRALNRSRTVDGIYVVTNALHQAEFLRWAEEFPEVQVLSDQTRTNDERLGAVACLQLAIKHFNIQDHVVVIGGDTLFREDFSLGAVEEKFCGLQASGEDGCLVLSYQCGDRETQKYGILEVDRDLRVLRMKEKPEPSETESRRAVSPSEEELYSHGHVGRFWSSPPSRVLLSSHHLNQVEVWTLTRPPASLQVLHVWVFSHLSHGSLQLLQSLHGPPASLINALLVQPVSPGGRPCPGRSAGGPSSLQVHMMIRTLGGSEL
uniref:Zgc:136439 n=1 Tax=Fundulus heteroclitus TaxID=8078 RepID=A0A3Q2PAV1_FUNHE